MRIKQLSVFLENQPGHLSQICSDLAEAGINIVTLSLADTSEFGILRLIVREWEHAREVLRNAGHTVNATDVIAIQIEDHPGGMESVLKLIEDGGVSVEYIYAFTIKEGEDALLVIGFDDIDRASAVLEASAIEVLSSISFYAERA